jgi:hypothetical protein
MNKNNFTSIENKIEDHHNELREMLSTSINKFNTLPSQNDIEAIHNHLRNLDENMSSVAEKEEEKRKKSINELHNHMSYIDDIILKSQELLKEKNAAIEEFIDGPKLELHHHIQQVAEVTTQDINPRQQITDLKKEIIMQRVINNDHL